MTEQQKVHVNLPGAAYDIEIGSGNLADLGPLVAQRNPSLAAVITDSNVRALYADQVTAVLDAVRCRSLLEVVEAGEGSKSIVEADRLWQSLLSQGADRKSMVIAVGGGVVGDLAGFVAATYARGIPLLQIPTTLLAQVDSSVGGKVGVNLPNAKNMVGAFWQPDAVLIDTDVLSTLPDREYRSGLAEVVKYGVILDADFFGYLEAQVDAINDRQPEVLRQIVARCCRLKADVVEGDEREESGLRAILNYGHTFCHAIEAVSGYGEFLHGEAVAIGMRCASRLAESLQRIPSQVTQRQTELLRALHLPLDVPEHLARSDLLAAMYRDKKTEHGRLRFILPSRIGEVEIVDGVDDQSALAAMESSV